MEYQLPEKAAETRKLLEKEIEDGQPSFCFTPKDGILYDVGMEYYGEFICSLKTGYKFLKEGMTLNGKKGTVSVVSRETNGVQLRFRPA